MNYRQTWFKSAAKASDLEQLAREHVPEGTERK